MIYTSQSGIPKLRVVVNFESNAIIVRLSSGFELFPKNQIDDKPAHTNGITAGIIF